jgi:hypothetical protein
VVTSIARAMLFRIVLTFALASSDGVAQLAALEFGSGASGRRPPRARWYTSL